MTLSTQPQLDLFRRNGQPAIALRAAHRLELDVMELTLKLRGRRWVVKTDLMKELGWSERRIQDAKEHSDGRIISSSRRGYCLGEEATVEEYREAMNEQRARARTILSGYLKMARRFHQLQPTAAA
jgi:hypothetical protein